MLTGEARYEWRNQIPPLECDGGVERNRRISITLRKIREKTS